MRGKNARTLPPGPDAGQFHLRPASASTAASRTSNIRLIEACSPGPFLELFARGARDGWLSWGNQADAGYAPTWATYSHNSGGERRETGPGPE